MTSRTGIDAQLGVADEVTWGTPVTPNRFFEFTPPESIKRIIDRIPSGGVRPGKLNKGRSGAYASHDKGAAGSVDLEIWNKGFGFWLKHMLGAVATSQPDAGGAPTVYLHTGSISSLVGKGVTVQVGRPNANDGTVEPFTYEGGKVTAWEVKTAVGGLAVCTLEFDFEQERTDTALEVASYPASPTLFSFIEGKASVAGSEVKVTDFSLRGANNVRTDRFFTGGTKREQLETGRDITGALAAEFESLTAYNRFVNATEVALELLFQGATISGAFKYELKITVPAVRFDGETPAVESTEELKQPLPIVALDDSLTMAYQTTDATP